MKISLCMIVKNEEKKLGNCLKNAVNFVDEIVVVDTGSIDNTIKIANMYTNKVYDFKWCDDFSAARNYSLGKASNDWVLVIDADEVIEFFSKELILGFIRKKDDIVGRVKRINPFEDENGVKKYIERVNRLFNKKYYKYEGIIHEQIIRKDDCEYITEDVDIVLNHVGYMDEVIADTDKINRNIKLLNRALDHSPNDPYIYYQLGKSKFKAKNYEEAVLNFGKTISIEKNIKLEYMIDAIESYGYALLKCEKYNDALSLNKYDELYASKATYNFLMGLIYMNNAMFTDSIKYFHKCLELENEEIEGISSYLPNYNIGVIYESLGETEKALMYYEKSSNYKLSKERIGYFKKEIQVCKDEINEYISKNDIGKAMDIIKKIDIYKFYDSEIYSLEAIIFMINREYEYAESTLVEGLKLFCEDKDIVYNLAFLYENTAQLEDALKYYKLLLELTGVDKEIVDKIDEIEIILGGSSK